MKTSVLYLVNGLMRLLPQTRCYGVKRVLLRLAGAEIGSNVRIVSSVSVYVRGKLTVGDGTFIGHRTLIVGGNGEMRIGSDVDIGPNVTLVGGSHEIDTLGARSAGKGFSEDIVIGNGVWIGCGATILGGAAVGEKAVIAAAALVKGNIPTRTVAAGIPAVVMRELPPRVAERN